MLAMLLAMEVAVAAAGPAPEDPGFDRAPFVSPRAVERLVGGMGADGEQAVAVELARAEATDAGGELTVWEDEDANPVVMLEDDDADGELLHAPFVAYQLVGTTASGVQVLRVQLGTGGSGVFERLLLVRIERQEAFAFDRAARRVRLDRERLVLRRLGEIPLGDRYAGAPAVEGDDILIPRDARDVDPLWAEDGVVHVGAAPALHASAEARR